MGCAPDGAHVKISTFGGAVQLDVSSQGLRAHRSISRLANGKIVARNNSFFIDNNSPHRGRGAELLSNQIQALRAIGAKKMSTFGIGSFQNSGRTNGYYTWPRLGYDGKIDPDDFAKLPREHQEAMGSSRSIRDLFDLPGGKEAWELHGSAMDYEFDLTDGSRSLLANEQYTEERRQDWQSQRAAPGTPERQAELEAAIQYGASQLGGRPRAQSSPGSAGATAGTTGTGAAGRTGRRQ